MKRETAFTFDCRGRKYELPRRRSKKVAVLEKLLLEAMFSSPPEVQFELLDVLTRSANLFAALSERAGMKGASQCQ